MSKNLRDTNPTDLTEVRKPEEKSFTGEHHDLDSSSLAKHLRTHKTAPADQLDDNPTSAAGDTAAGTNVEAPKQGWSARRAEAYWHAGAETVAYLYRRAAGVA